MSTPQDDGQRGDRLTSLEQLFMHLERQVAEVNQVVLDQGEQIERLKRELRRLEQPADEPAANELESDEPLWE